MKLNLHYSEFEKKMTSFIKELEELSKQKISNETEYDNLESSFTRVKDNCASYIETVISKDVGRELSNLIRYENRYNFGMKIPLTQKSKNLIDRIKDRIRSVKYLIQIIKISDPLYLGKSFEKERSNLTTNEKASFLLSKLYSLRKTNQLWDTKMILEFNQVELDNYDEARGVTKILENNGYVETIGNKNGLSAKITSEGKLFWEENSKPVSKKEIETNMDIFISHSSQDSDTAKLLIDLLKTSLNLSSSKIRCTSVNGYRLPAGATTDEVLKKEVHDSKVLIGLISPNSINSAYVLFELGARWGASLPLIPLITSELGSELLKGPLSGINALNCCEPAQLQQLISDLKTVLKITGESPEVYQDKIELLVNHSLIELLPNSNVNKSSVKQNKKESKNLTDKNDDKIKSYCEKQWPDDYSMRVHCIKEQREAKQDIESFKPLDIPEDVFNRILEKAISEWPTDYTMQVHSRNEQIEAYLELNDL
ncbi:MAG: toll/interleukin-1 receptor domain-containing protein [Flavobacteriaceae bacterium]